MLFIQILLIIGIILLLLIRISWIRQVKISFAILVAYYCLINKVDKPLEYLHLWPDSYFYLYFWRWHLRDFVINQDKFDEMTNYFERQLNIENAKQQ